MAVPIVCHLLMIQCTSFTLTWQLACLPGAYIFDLIKEAQELVRAKLVTINGFLRTMIKTNPVK